MLQITGVKDLSLAHVKVTKVSILDGAIYINILISGSSFTVAKQNVIGKVVKVITIFSQEWEDTFYQFKQRKWLLRTLQKHRVCIGTLTTLTDARL